MFNAIKGIFGLGVPSPVIAQVGGTLLDRVRDAMSDGEWHELSEIKNSCGGSDASVSARLRDLRKEKYGGHTVICKREGGFSNQSYMYRMET